MTGTVKKTDRLRVLCNAPGQVELKVKTPWRDGTTHLVMLPLEFMLRLAALIPRPRLHLIRFHAALARNNKPRSLAMPKHVGAFARDFNGSIRSIFTWVTQAAAASGRPVCGKDALTSAEREELARLRREYRQLK